MMTKLRVTTHCWFCDLLFFVLLALGGLQMAVGQSPPVPTSSYIDQTRGTSIDQPVEMSPSRNADLLAARQRITEAQGLHRQAGFRANPSINASVGNRPIRGTPGEREIADQPVKYIATTMHMDSPAVQRRQFFVARKRLQASLSSVTEK